MSKTAENMRFHYRIIRRSLCLQNYMNQCDFCTKTIKQVFCPGDLLGDAYLCTLHVAKKKRVCCTHKHMYNRPTFGPKSPPKAKVTPAYGTFSLIAKGS